MTAGADDHSAEAVPSPFGPAEHEKGGALGPGAGVPNAGQRSVEIRTMPMASGEGVVAGVAFDGGGVKPEVSNGEGGGGDRGVGGGGEGTGADDGRAWGGADEDGEEVGLGLTALFGSEEGLTLVGSGGNGDAIERGRRQEENAFLEVYRCQSSISSAASALNTRNIVFFSFQFLLGTI